MFNVRIFKYSNTGYQIRIYEEPQNIDYDDTIDRTPWCTSKNLEHLNKNYVFNPFSDSWEWLPDFDLLPIKDEKKMAERSAYNSMARAKNNIFYLARSNSWEWFVTLTFNPDKVDSFDYDEVTKKLSLWLNNARKKCPDMKYLVVPEQHKSGRWHFHGIFSNIDELGFIDSGLKTKKNEPIYNLNVYRLGFSTATKVSSTEKVSKYISKYITKDVCLSTKGKKRYWHSKNLYKAEIQDTILTVDEKEKLINMLSSDILHIKSTVNKEFGFGVTYIEVKKGVEFDI